MQRTLLPVLALPTILQLPTTILWESESKIPLMFSMASASMPILVATVPASILEVPTCKPVISTLSSKQPTLPTPPQSAVTVLSGWFWLTIWVLGLVSSWASIPTAWLHPSLPSQLVLTALSWPSTTKLVLIPPTTPPLRTTTIQILM